MHIYIEAYDARSDIYKNDQICISYCNLTLFQTAYQKKPSSGHIKVVVVCNNVLTHFSLSGNS